MQTILVPVDGSDHAFKALHVACDLAAKYDGSIVLLHIVSEGRTAREALALRIASSFNPGLRGSLKRLAADPKAPLPADLAQKIGELILEQAAERTTRRGVEVKSHQLETGEPAEVILIAQKRTSASTIVMGCRGVGATEDATFGSVSQAVFQRADCTCISVK